ncbi:hypothetical protein PM082_014223 [Marasmius tenuissimus]|nr:hypothetical protein PM082_014223 [Marasmius tenuissimus]
MEEAEADWAHVCISFHNDQEHLHHRAIGRLQADNAAADAHAARLLHQTPLSLPSRSLNAQPPSSPSSTRPVRFNGVLIGWVLYVGSLDGVEAHSNLKSAHDALKVALSEGPAIIILAQEIEQAADANRTMQLSYTLEHAELEDEPEGAK